MEEDWRIIYEFPDYAISNLGVIRRIRPDSYGRHNGIIMQQKPTHGGYMQCSLTGEYGRLTILVNRAVCAAFHGEAPSLDHQAAHKDGNRRNNRADNLRWSTRSENENDKRAHGTMRVGEKHHMAIRPSTITRGSRIGTSKLTEEQVSAIRLDRRSRAEIAAEYGITKSHISDIRSRKIWTHVQ